MPQNFIVCDREQELLLPPSLRDWLPADHLVWFLLDAVEQINLAEIYGSYRADGWGRAAFDPGMMVTLLLYSYAIGERSSRAIERRCCEDVAFRVITANQIPDHVTIARFRVRHEQALAGQRAPSARSVRRCSQRLPRQMPQTTSSLARAAGQTSCPTIWPIAHHAERVYSVARPSFTRRTASANRPTQKR